MRPSLVCSLAFAATFPLSCQRSAPPATGSAQRPAATAQRAAATNANYYRMKKVAVVDEHSFERPMRAVTLLVPTDWQFQGKVGYLPMGGCHLDLMQVTFAAASPDSRVAVEMFPVHHWRWVDDRFALQAMQMGAQQAMQFGRKECDIMPPMMPGDYLQRMVIPKARPNAHVVGIEPLPEVAQKLQQEARRQEALSAQVGVPLQIRAEAARARLEYSLNGQGVEEWLTAVTFAAARPGPSFNMATGQMGQTLFYDCGAYLMYAMRAPRGQLQAQEKFFNLVLGTVQLDPAWQERVSQVVLNMTATDMKGARDRAAIIAKSQREISGIINETYENKQRSQERNAQEFSQYIRGVETYRNPHTGETVELSNQYGHAWMNNSNEYILTDSPGFDPNVVLRGNWTALERAK